MFLEDGVERRFRAEANFLGDSYDGVVLLGRIDQQFLGLLHAIGVDEVKEVLAKSFIDDL